MQLPWKRQKRPPVTARTSTGALRQLYSGYQKQTNLWGYTLLSSMVLICLWIVFSVFHEVDFKLLSLPLAGILISSLQMYRIKNISRVLRQAHTIQQQVDKAEAERKQKADEEAAEKEKKAGLKESRSNGPTRMPEAPSGLSGARSDDPEDPG